MRIKHLLLFTALSTSVAGLGFGLSSCSKGSAIETDGFYHVRASINGAQERPASVVTPAYGGMTGRYNNDTKEFSYTINYTDLKAPAQAMHFHGPATAAQVAPPLITITGFPAARSGSVSGKLVLNEEQKQQLLNGLWYVNIHTSVHPGGEIRGQVVQGR